MAPYAGVMVGAFPLLQHIHTHAHPAKGEKLASKQASKQANTERKKARQMPATTKKT
jgi:hypothetical protein